MDGDESKHLTDAIADNDKKRLLSYKRLIYAIVNDDMQEFEMHLPHADPKIQQFQALRAAVDFGRLEMVRRLLPVSDANAVDCAALRTTCRNGNQEMFDLLYPHCDPSKALVRLKQGGATETVLWMLEQRMNSDHQRSILSAAVHNDQPTTKRKT